MSGPIINIQKLTVPAAIVISAAWVTVNNGLRDGLGFLIAAAIFYGILIFVEWQMFVDDHHHGRR